MSVLLVEDEQMLGEAMRIGLEHQGYNVTWVQDGQSALSTIQNYEYDIILLDLNLPRLHGLEVLQKSRALGIKTPILILTANDAVEDRVKGLDCGADDYCTKPFDLKELGARIRALLRRAQGRVENIIRYKNLTIEPEAHKASIDDQELTISRREFSLLHKLVENQGKVMSRDALTQALYGWDDEVDSNALEVHIHNLRKKIGSDVIKTVRGVGYIVQQEEKD